MSRLSKHQGLALSLSDIGDFIMAPAQWVGALGSDLYNFFNDAAGSLRGFVGSLDNFVGDLNDLLSVCVDAWQSIASSAGWIVDVVKNQSSTIWSAATFEFHLILLPYTAAFSFVRGEDPIAFMAREVGRSEEGFSNELKLISTYGAMVPGVGAPFAAAAGVGYALLNGEPLSQAAVDGLTAGLPLPLQIGARAGLSVVSDIERGKSIETIGIDAVRAGLPDDQARRGFDIAVALAEHRRVSGLIESYVLASSTGKELQAQALTIVRSVDLKQITDPAQLAPRLNVSIPLAGDAMALAHRALASGKTRTVGGVLANAGLTNLAAAVPQKFGASAKHANLLQGLLATAIPKNVRSIAQDPEGTFGAMVNDLYAGLNNQKNARQVLANPGDTPQLTPYGNVLALLDVQTRVIMLHLIANQATHDLQPAPLAASASESQHLDFVNSLAAQDVARAQAINAQQGGNGEVVGVITMAGLPNARGLAFDMNYLSQAVQAAKLQDQADRQAALARFSPAVQPAVTAIAAMTTATMATSQGLTTPVTNADITSTLNQIEPTWTLNDAITNLSLSPEAKAKLAAQKRSEALWAVTLGILGTGAAIGAGVATYSLVTHQPFETVGRSLVQKTKTTARRLVGKK